MKKFIAITVLALALIFSWPRVGMAFCLLDVCPPPPPPASGIGQAASIGVGPWIVGGLMVSVASVMVRAAVVKSCQHRELTSSEATGAVLLPFAWLILGAAADPGHRVAYTADSCRFSEASLEQFIALSSKLISTEHQKQLQDLQKQLQQLEMEKANIIRLRGTKAGLGRIQRDLDGVHSDIAQFLRQIKQIQTQENTTQDKNRLQTSDNLQQQLNRTAGQLEAIQRALDCFPDKC